MNRTNIVQNRNVLTEVSLILGRMDDHYEEKQLLFDQTHDIEQLLMVAIQRGMAPADSELIKLRARIETFTLAERMVSLAQETAIR